MKAALDAIAAGGDIVVADLAAILSIDTSYPPGENYPDLVAWAEARLAPFGFTTRRVEVPAPLWQVHGAGAHGARVNLVAERDGPDPVGIYCHMDVVPAGDGWSVPPFAATRQGEWILGRGSADMKASIAALMLAMEMAHRFAVPLRYAPKILLATDEEGGAYPGIRYLAEQGHVPTHLLCLDGGAAPRIWSGAFGSLELLLEVQGVAGHSGQRGSGDNALERAIPIMAALMALKPIVEARVSALTDRNGDALHPIFAVTVAQAGLKANIIPDLCRVAMNRRYMPEEDDAVVLAEIRDAIAAAAPPGTRWSLHVTGHLAAVSGADQGPHWPRWSAAMAESFGWDVAESRLWGATSSSDMGWVQRARAPGESRGILIGGAIRPDSRVHGVDERVRIADIQSLAAAILRYLAGEFALTRKMKLIAYLKTGPTATMPGGWRHPKARLNDFLGPVFYEDMARALERGMFDGCFFADTFGIPDVHAGSFRTYVERGGQISYLDPMLVLPLMARVTQHLGIGATLSTTFHPPYLLARMLASLDLVSDGRACWNIVTSATNMEARNFGMDGIPPKEARYDQADEVVEACCALWNSWDADALVLDQETGIFADPDKVHYSDYHGKHIRTRGPLAMPRSPQGRPVFLQAGSSDRGRDFAARWAEAVFASNAGKANSIAFYDDLKSRMDRYGRSPDQCKILASSAIVVGETDSIARERAAELIAMADDDLTVATNSAMMGADLSKLMDPAGLAAAQGNQGIFGSQERVMQVMRAEGISFAEALRRPRGGLLVGTPSGIADQMQELFEAGGCDGWILWPTVSPWMYEEFATHVTPELQRRGLLRTAYSGRTMRENLMD